MLYLGRITAKNVTTTTTTAIIKTIIIIIVNIFMLKFYCNEMKILKSNQEVQIFRRYDIVQLRIDFRCCWTRRLLDVQF